MTQSSEYSKLCQEVRYHFSQTLYQIQSQNLSNVFAMDCEELHWPTSYTKCSYLFSNKNLQQEETNIKPNILEDIPVGFNALNKK